MMNTFYEVSYLCSKATTEKYSTSFSSAIRLLHKDFHKPVYSVYGFVRFADEIVDTFHQYDKTALLQEFKKETYTAIERGISLNPILQSFQQTVRRYQISLHLVDAFFASMQMDLTPSQHDNDSYKQYIYGSAEAVGLMCLYIFCEGNTAMYHQLMPHAQALGAAFQKVNFLRDANEDRRQLNRSYFPDVDFDNFTTCAKKSIEADIETDFANAYSGIVLLPAKARFAVYVAYKYYLSLFNKMRRAQPKKILQHRFSVPHYGKILIVAKASLRLQLNML